MKAQRIELRPGANGERLDKLLSQLLPEISRSQWQRLIGEGHVLVDGHVAKSSQRIDGSPLINVDIPEASESELLPEQIPLDVRYEDDDLIVINKPPGLVVHPGPGHDSGTLVNALLAHCPDLPGVGDTRRPGIVHRLDKNTSGLIVAAKNDLAMHFLQAQFKKRTVDKRYLALVDGRIRPEAALIDAPIGRDPLQRKRMSVIAPGSPRASSSRARAARTRYVTVEQFADHTLVECAPLTGRTHQIRVHLAYVGFPIVGDRVYGRRKPSLPIERHFLHAAQLSFNRPSDQSRLTLMAELPPDLAAVLESLS
ncbi:MAG: RluA family pseudouridine synthase [Candidatus Promineifilaceae bacterium]